MNPLFTTLLSWAVTLSGHPTPPEPPEVLGRPHAFFVDQACNHQECKVLGWYAGGRNIYIDENLDPERDLLASSIVVHEMVHYLQGVARGDDLLRSGAAFNATPSCQQLVRWEFEAYAVQRAYILQYGTYMPVGASMLHAHCETGDKPAAPGR